MIDRGLRDITKATGMGARARYLSGLIYIYNMDTDIWDLADN